LPSDAQNGVQFGKNIARHYPCSRNSSFLFVPVIAALVQA